MFDEFRARLAGVLGEVAVRIDHVGSTAVPRLPAKPVIDIQVSVRDVEDEESYRDAIESLGWPLRAREQDHRFFRPPSSDERTVHVHV
ncbi:MAG: GrpB family protein, partial [Acidimicrobiia bacterium]